jgi:hypothetical protein
MVRDGLLVVVVLGEGLLFEPVAERTGATWNES